MQHNQDVYMLQEGSRKKMIQENRESVTICPIVSLAGTLILLTIKSFHPVFKF